jgi:phosphate transport system substrate-binding protein
VRLRIGRVLVSLAVGAAFVLSGCGAPAPTASAPPAPGGGPRLGNPSKPVTVEETGSTLVLPFLQKMVDPLRARYPNVTLAPAGGGSGKGISDVISGTARVGGSDAYLSDAQARQHPDFLNIPIAISAQAIDYNLPGVRNLKITGEVLAQIYMGKIARWNDPAIARLNPGLSLPATTIVPVRRVDASGDTFIFTSLLTRTNQDWANGPAFGTTVTWPAAPGELTANGNPAMVQVCKATPGCVAYIGVSVEQTALQQGLGEAMLQNRAGNFVIPTQDTISAAAAQGAQNLPADLRAPLIYLDGAQTYPIVNFEYMMVNSKQPDADTALALRDFLAFAIDPSQGSTQANLGAVDFVALPPNVTPRVSATIARISG